MSQIIVKTGGIYEILINMPENANRLTNKCMDEVVDSLKTAENDGECYAIIFGTVGDVFCLGGGELADYRVSTTKDIRAFGDYFIRLHTAFGRTPKPVICAVQGEAIGGGFSLIEACDLAVCAEDALLSISELMWGLPPAMGMTGLYEEMTKKTVMEMGLLGRKLTAKEALKYGMVNAVVPKDEVMDTARKMASTFADKNPTSIAIFKEIYRQMGLYAYERRMESAQSLLVSCFKSNDGFEVLNAKDEKRAPVWKGN